MQGIVSTMDSEWDKIILRSIYSRKEIIVLGFDPDNLPSMTNRVKFVVEEVKILLRQQPTSLGWA